MLKLFEISEIEQIEHDELEIEAMSESIARDLSAHDSRDEFSNAQFVRFADRQYR